MVNTFMESNTKAVTSNFIFVQETKYKVINKMHNIYYDSPNFVQCFSKLDEEGGTILSIFPRFDKDPLKDFFKYFSHSRTFWSLPNIPIRRHAFFSECEPNKCLL